MVLGEFLEGNMQNARPMETMTPHVTADVSSGGANNALTRRYKGLYQGTITLLNFFPEPIMV